MTAADFERTRDALLADGLDLRRERNDLRDTRMAFFRAGPTIVELVGAPGGETRLWGWWRSCRASTIPIPLWRRISARRAMPSSPPHRHPAPERGNRHRRGVHEPPRRRPMTLCGLLRRACAGADDPIRVR